jgi:hypothetical protein
VFDNFWYHISWSRNSHVVKVRIEYVQQESCGGPPKLTLPFASILFKQISEVTS